MLLRRSNSSYYTYRRSYSRSWNRVLKAISLAMVLYLAMSACLYQVRSSERRKVLRLYYRLNYWLVTVFFNSVSRFCNSVFNVFLFWVPSS